MPSRADGQIHMKYQTPSILPGHPFVLSFHLNLSHFPKLVIATVKQPVSKGSVWDHLYLSLSLPQPVRHWIKFLISYFHSKQLSRLSEKGGKSKPTAHHWKSCTWLWESRALGLSLSLSIMIILIRKWKILSSKKGGAGSLSAQIKRQAQALKLHRLVARHLKGANSNAKLNPFSSSSREREKKPPRHPANLDFANKDFTW